MTGEKTFYEFINLDMINDRKTKTDIKEKQL